jgi:hypothetical protein
MVHRCNIYAAILNAIFKLFIPICITVSFAQNTPDGVDACFGNENEVTGGVTPYQDGGAIVVPASAALTLGACHKQRYSNKAIYYRKIQGNAYPGGVPGGEILL